MIISFTNVIGAIRSLGEAAQVITTNLKMWLGFETSETLGRELAPSSLSIENGSGGGTITQISENSYSSSSDGNNSSTIRPKFDFNTESGKTYKLVITPTGTISGTVHFDFNDGVSYLFQDYDFTTTKEIYFTDNGQVFGAFNGQQVYNITGFTISLKELTQITPDKSGNNNVGELFTGKALEFDGAGDNVGIAFTTPIKSAVFWVKPLSTGIENILSLGGAFGGSKYIRLNGNGIQTQGLSSVSIYVNDVQSSNAPLNQWSRVVVNFATVTPLELKFGYAFNSYGNIQLSDVQLYNENLSTDDIAYDYANPQNLVTDRSGTSIGLSNLKGYWHLSEGAGSVAYDSSGEGNNGTINGATYEPAQPRIPQLGMMNWAKSTPVADEITLIANPSIPTQDILGNAVRDRLNSFNLDGSGYAEVADDADLDIGTGAFTMECWVKADFVNTGSSVNVIYSLGGEYANTDTATIAASSTIIRARIGANNLTADNNYTVGDWYHVCITRDDSASGLCTLYIDAVAQADTETTSASIANTSNKLIGRDTLMSRFYKNLISDVRLYDAELSATEIENNYNAGLSAHTNN